MTQNTRKNVRKIFQEKAEQEEEEEEEEQED